MRLGQDILYQWKNMQNLPKRLIHGWPFSMV
jgi:hypothetical protein